MFDVPYGQGGTDGQVDVGTQHSIVEVKVGSVTDGSDTLNQIQKVMTNDQMNPPNRYGKRKYIILYAPGYGKAATASIQAAGGYVVRSCEQLHEQLRTLGGL